MLLAFAVYFEVTIPRRVVDLFYRRHLCAIFRIERCIVKPTVGGGLQIVDFVVAEIYMYQFAFSIRRHHILRRPHYVV